MQGTTVGQGLPPSAVFAVTPAMKSSFMDLFSTLGSRGPGGGGATGGGGVTAGVGASGVAGGIPGGGGSAPGSGFLGINQPGTGGIIPLDPTIAGNPVGVVTPPLVVPTTAATAATHRHHHNADTDLCPHIRRGDGDAGCRKKRGL